MHGGLHRAYTLEQLRAIDLSVVHEHVGVGVGRRREVALADLGSDLCPGLALVMHETDPAMPEVMRAEDGYGGIPAGSRDRHAQAVRRADRDERCPGIAIFPSRQAINEHAVEVVG